VRIDKLLWFLRFAKTRGLAQDWVAQGHIRLNGRRIERASAHVAAGDVLVLMLGAAVRVVEVVALPERRGPASEAQACYRLIDPAGGPAGGSAATSLRDNAPARHEGA